MKISVYNDWDHIPKAEKQGQDQVVLTWDGEYRKGDIIEFSGLVPETFYMVKADAALEEAFVLIKKDQVLFPGLDAALGICAENCDGRQEQDACQPAEKTAHITVSIIYYRNEYGSANSTFAPSGVKMFRFQRLVIPIEGFDIL